MTFRRAEGCNAWFWCKEGAGCREPHSGAAAAQHECLLHAVAMLPLPLPPPEQWAAASHQLSSFAAGFLLNEGADPGVCCQKGIERGF